MHKYPIETVVVTQPPARVTYVHVIRPQDRLDDENPRWPWDADVKARKSLAIDCRELDKGMGR